MSLDLKKKDITWDVLLTQRSIAHQVRKQVAHYHAPIKGNHRRLLADLELQFQSPSATPAFQTIAEGCGNGEVHSVWVTQTLDDYIKTFFDSLRPTNRRSRTTRLNSDAMR